MSETAKDLDAAVALSRAAVAGVISGDAQRIQDLYSTADDVTLGNPFGPFVKGRQAVEATTAAAAARYHGGQLAQFDTVARFETDSLACVVETENFETRLAEDGPLTPLSLRVTSVYRREGDAWHLVHRHADPITTPRGVDTLRAN